MNRRGIALIAGLVVAASLFAQATKPSFEVASIKGNRSVTAFGGPPVETPDRFAVTGWPLSGLISYAYHLRPWQLKGGPDWINSQRWDLDARAPEGVSLPRPTRADLYVPNTTALMLQDLMEKRFGLTVRREMREVPIYELSVSKGGPKIKLDTDPGTPQTAERGFFPRGGPFQLRPGDLVISRGRIEAKAVSITAFIEYILQMFDRPVVDKTGLKDTYSFRVQWDTEDAGAGQRSTLATDSPSFFTAFDEQLGLHLAAAKGPGEILVIESVHRPSEN